MILSVCGAWSKHCWHHVFSLCLICVAEMIEQEVVNIAESSPAKISDSETLPRPSDILDSSKFDLKLDKSNILMLGPTGSGASVCLSVTLCHCQSVCLTVSLSVCVMLWLTGSSEPVCLTICLSCLLVCLEIHKVDKAAGCEWCDSASCRSQLLATSGGTQCRRYKPAQLLTTSGATQCRRYKPEMTMTTSMVTTHHH